MGRHVFTFTTISNDTQQMDQKTNLMAEDGAGTCFFSSSFPEERLVHFCRKRLLHRLSLNLNGSQFFSYIFYIRKVSYFCFLFSENCASLSTGSEEASGPRITFSSSYTNKRARSQATILTAVSQDLYTCINYTGTMFRYHVALFAQRTRNS